LPAYYVEELIAQVNEDNLTCKAFLDIFHQHLYEMLYAVWAKYRLSHQIAEENNHHLLQIIYNLAGLGFTHQPALLKENSDWAKYIRFFMAGNRNLTNLQELLTDYFATAVKIESFYPALIAIHPEQKNQLGVLQSTLGNFYLGEYFQSATTNLLLSFRELTQQQALLFMQNGKNSQQLKTLLNTYLITPYNFFIELQFDSAAPMPTALGGHARLGQTTQMGVPLGPRLTRVTYLL
jgi:type VI secretion system ImpH/TssG family protein